VDFSSERPLREAVVAAARLAATATRERGRRGAVHGVSGGSFSSSSRDQQIGVPPENVSHFTAGSLSRLRVSATVRRTVSEVARSESVYSFHLRRAATRKGDC